MAAAGLLWWSDTLYHGAAVRLADGREVSALAVTYGTNHVFVDGKWWVKLLGLASPARAFKLGLRIYRRQSSTPTLMVWTNWRPPPKNLGREFAPRFASVCDRHGLESEPEAAAVEAPRSNSSDTLLAWRLVNYPRRQSKVLLRFYERDAAYRLHRVGQVSVRNGAAGVGPTWRAPGPPVSVWREGRQFSLVGLRGGLVPSKLSWPLTCVAPWTTALFEVRENGQVSAEWTLKSLEVFGATGNRFAIPQPYVGQVGEQLATSLPHIELSENGPANEPWTFDSREVFGPAGNYFALPQPRVGQVSAQLARSFPHVLWADEPDWKLVVEFWRARNFALEDLWTFKSLPAIRRRPPFTTNCQAVVHGVTLQSLDIRATTQIRPHRPDQYRRTTDLTLLFTSALARVHVELARVTDDRGRELRFADGTETWIGNYPVRYTVGLEVPLDATWLDLTFGIRQSEVVEFLVNPGLVSYPPAAAISPPVPPAAPAPP